MTDSCKSITTSMAFRLKRAEQALARANLDALIAATPENVIYLSGAYNPVRKLMPERPAIVLWPAKCSPILIAAAVEEVFLKERSAISELGLYQGATEAAVKVLVEALHRQRLGSARLGLDLEGVSAQFYRELRQNIPKARIEDASGLVADLRAVKSEGEVEALRHAAASTDRAEWLALDDFKAGWTENELGCHLRQALISQGAETVAFLILGSGPRGVAAHALPSDTAPTSGELVRFDMGGIFAGWASDLAKTACVGEASQRQRRIYRTLRSILDEHIARIRPGQSAGDLYEAVAADFQKAKLNFRAPHVGHGIGLGVHERPILSPGNPTPIRAGMVICAELIHVEQGRERYHLEEMVYVHEGEAEVISRSRSAPLEIPVIG